MAKQVKKLYLSSNNKKISGVCGGIGEYFEVDPTIIRLVWILLTVVTGLIPGILAYIVTAIVMPKHLSSKSDK